MQPFVKWAGGKRQLLEEINKRIPDKFDTYYEPFIGGGALLFDLKPQKAYIGDVNKILIDSYKTIKNDVKSLTILLDEFTRMHNAAEDKKEFYYEMRNNYNEKIQNNDIDVVSSALFIYLNKTCFNGLYRVNSKGLFNVPFNNRKTLTLYDEDNLNEISEYLKNINILYADFEKTCENAKKGDFVFFDSPYAPLKPDSFESYTKEGFALEEHIRLANLFKRLTEKGVYCMLTNHNTKLINELYKDYKIDVVQVKRMINSDVNHRNGEEVIITNY
ncbi:MAG: DNA adenine methylase [Traorella sp.]